MTEIPNAFGGFAPFPNTIMIPTMGLQSDVIGFRFGFGYEKGKRTLRAMSNEQFNDLDEEAEQAIYKRHDSIAIHFFELEIQNWTNLQKIIIEKSVEIEVMKANRTPSAFREMFEGFTSGFATQQKDDAGKFFASLTDPIMKLMAWFAGHKTTIIDPNQDPTKFQPPSEPEPTPELIPTTGKILSLTFTASNPAKISSTKSYSYSGEVGYHKLIIRQFEVIVDGLLKHKSPTSWEVKAYVDIIYRYRLAFKNSEGYWI